ncbi:MAG: hypothetical protein IJ271_05570 [Bacteroidales bacterium]|nr:hypothetical protein [Bacteroidales bacterium]MBQ8049105.1 hypothetical protein [Bacteroidales bacterium]
MGDDGAELVMEPCDELPDGDVRHEVGVVEGPQEVEVVGLAAYIGEVMKKHQMPEVELGLEVVRLDSVAQLLEGVLDGGPQVQVRGDSVALRYRDLGVPDGDGAGGVYDGIRRRVVYDEGRALLWIHVGGHREEGDVIEVPAVPECAGVDLVRAGDVHLRHVVGDVGEDVLQFLVLSGGIHLALLQGKGCGDALVGGRLDEYRALLPEGSALKYRFLLPDEALAPLE